jgi:DNA-binding GntR family transcriptional regulator
MSPISNDGVRNGRAEKNGKRVKLESIYVALRDRICLLDYPPGTILREAELAAEFGVSRTPIRTVLQRLAYGGLVESRDGVGTIVTSLTVEELRDIYELRLKIAELIGQLSPKPCGPAEVAAAAALRARAEKLARDFDLIGYWRINHDLHLLIGSLIGNVALRHMWDHFYFQVARIWYALAKEIAEDVSASLVNELTEIHHAIIEGDLVAVGYIERNYIAFGLRRVSAHLSRNSPPANRLPRAAEELAQMSP